MITKDLLVAQVGFYVGARMLAWAAMVPVGFAIVGGFFLEPTTIIIAMVLWLLAMFGALHFLPGAAYRRLGEIMTSTIDKAIATSLKGKTR